MSHEEDALIAEKLFGWKWMSFVGIPIRGTEGYPQKMRVRQFMSDSQMQNERWQKHFNENGGAPATGDEPLSYAYCSSQGSDAMLPAYTSDPAADYSVLVKVRETWGVSASRDCAWDFWSSLAEIWETRRDVLKAIPLSLGLLYEPGDYSRAALAVLKAKQPASPGEPA